VNDEQRLVAAAAAGSEQAGEELFARHWPAAWRLALSMTGSSAAADDIAQDAFERAFRGLAGFNGRSSFRTWLSRIVVNRATDVRRQQHRPQPLDLAEALLSPWSDDDVLRDRDVLEAVAALAPERRTVVALRYWAQHSPAEIAEVLDLPLGTVHSRLARSLADLRSRLEVSDAHKS
jgi:RNA polymerase sigma-70 factor (ECF subfamily)